MLCHYRHNRYWNLSLRIKLHLEWLLHNGDNRDMHFHSVNHSLLHDMTCIFILPAFPVTKCIDISIVRNIKELYGKSYVIGLQIFVIPQQ